MLFFNHRFVGSPRPGPYSIVETASSAFFPPVVGVGATAVAPDIPARSIEDSQLAVGIAGVSRTSTFLMSTAQLSCSVCAAALRYTKHLLPAREWSALSYRKSDNGILSLSHSLSLLFLFSLLSLLSLLSVWSLCSLSALCWRKTQQLRPAGRPVADRPRGAHHVCDRDRDRVLGGLGAFARAAPGLRFDAHAERAIHLLSAAEHGVDQRRHLLGDRFSARPVSSGRMRRNCLVRECK
jgi:hypothetical protein